MGGLVQQYNGLIVGTVALVSAAAAVYWVYIKSETSGTSQALGAPTVGQAGKAEYRELLRDYQQIIRDIQSFEARANNEQTEFIKSILEPLKAYSLDNFLRQEPPDFERPPETIFDELKKATKFHDLAAGAFKAADRLLDAQMEGLYQRLEAIKRKAST